MTDTPTTPRPAINSKHHLAGYLTTPQARQLAGMTEKQMRWWTPYCPPEIGVAADIGQGGASTRRYSPHDVWKLCIVRHITTFAERRWAAELVGQAWAVAPVVHDMLRPRNAWVIFCDGPDGVSVRFSLTAPSPGELCATLQIPLAPAYAAMNAAREQADA